MAKWQRFRVSIPTGYGPSQRVAIANEIIEFIIKRSRAGEDMNHVSFPVYTDGYKNSINFSIASKGTRPNLTLTGDMLDSMELISHGVGTLLIGYPSGDDINGKVEGNRIGSYGADADEDKARDFFGINDKDKKDILNGFSIKTKRDKIKSKKKAIELVKIQRETREALDD